MSKFFSVDFLYQFMKANCVIGAVGLATFDNVCYISGVSGTSMQPTLNENVSEKHDRVFLVRPNLFKYVTSWVRGGSERPSASRMESFLKRGDVVSFVSPKDPSECFIKRVVGLPNDWICRVNYVPKKQRLSEAELENLDRLDLDDIDNGEDDDEDDDYVDFIKVPPGHIWIEGDNYKVSNDSNAFGAIPMGLVIGKAVFAYYPLHRIRWIESKLPPHRIYQPINLKSDDKNCTNAQNFKIKFSRTTK